MRRIVLSSFVMLAACGGRPEDATQPRGPSSGGQPSKIVVTPATASFVVGSTQSFIATVTDSAGNVLRDLPVTWESSAPTIATVSNTGIATAKSNTGVRTATDGVLPSIAYITASIAGISGSALARVAPSTGPRIASFTVSPSTVVLGASSTASARVIDATVGIDSVRVFFSSAPGSSLPERGCLMRLASGSKADGTWTCALDWELDAPSGWRMLSRIEATDGGGRTTSFLYSEAKAMGATSSVTVLASTADTTPPELLGFAMTSRSVSLAASNASQGVSTTVHAADSGTGIAQIFIELADADGFAAGGSACGMHFTPDPRTWTCNLLVTSKLGTHPVKSIELVDRAGNVRVYTNWQLLQAGYQASVTVTP